jgi:hypothetical protein
MSTMTDHTIEPKADPIDALIPPPRSRWARLAIGAVVVVVIGGGAFLWGFGYIVPQPGCCGSGSSSALMSLSPDGDAVTITASFYNSSGRDLTIRSATADLPGADVIDIALLDPDNNVYPTDNVHPFPTEIAGHALDRLLITFVPNTCEDTGEPWGSVTVGLDVANSWLPAFGRSYELPDPVISNAANDLVVFEPASLDGTPFQRTPLEAACALLGR